MIEKSKRRCFLSNSCNVCLKPNPAYECGVCKMVGYCSVEHRRGDWGVHAHLCRCIFRLCRARGVDRLYRQALGQPPHVYRQLRHQTAIECSNMLARGLHSWELEIIYFPKMCGVCYRQSEVVEGCQECGLVFWCGSDHVPADHRLWCPALALYHQLVRHSLADAAPHMPPMQLPSPLTSMHQVLQCTDKSAIENAYSSEVLTYPLTVRHGLLCQQGQVQQVVVHVVGAEHQAELLPLSKWELYLLHLLPHCQRLKMIFIGPSLDVPDELLPQSKLDVCLDCRENKKLLEYEIVAGTLYHDFHGTEKPDLIVALNAGLYRNIGSNGTDTWALTLEKMFVDKDYKSIPKLITEYTGHEMDEDVALLANRFPQLNTILPPQLNPFASTRPNRNVVSDHVVPVIFKNYYLTLLSA